MLRDWFGRAVGLSLPLPAPEARAGSMAGLTKAPLAWRAGRDHAAAELRRLQAALQAGFGEDEDQVAALARLEADLDRLLAAGEEQRGPLREAARAGIAAWNGRLDSDPILRELDGNELLPDLLAVAPLRADLAAMQAAL